MDAKKLTDSDVLAILRKLETERRDIMDSALFSLGISSDRRSMLIGQFTGDTPTPRRDALLEVLAA